MGYFAISTKRDDPAENLRAAKANIDLLLHQIELGHMDYFYLFDFVRGQVDDAFNAMQAAKSRDTASP